MTPAGVTGGDIALETGRIGRRSDAIVICATNASSKRSRSTGA